jgi:hypothetical protein
VGLIAINDLDSATAPKLESISTRGLVLTGDSIMIGGYIVGSGTGNKQVLIRAFGPTMADFGVAGPLADPVIELHFDHDNNPNTQAILLATNDDWGTDPTSCPPPLVACGTAIDIFNTGKSADTYAPTNPNRFRDSALLVTAPTGAYTVKVLGVGGATGVALIAINEMSP